MAKLMIVFDPTDKISFGYNADARERLVREGLRSAELSLGDDLGERDIYEIARRLSELLLEQLS